ncbi:MAG TPA: hypothetical protein EYP23_03420 [Thermoplasmata archaeon]|nr:hypothetical protein [Thermoplasmata archaeon]
MLNEEVNWEAEIEVEKVGKKEAKTKIEIEAEGEAVEIGETFEYTGDRAFTGRVQVVALALPEARFTKLKFNCVAVECSTKCLLSEGVTMELEGENFDPLAFASYFDTNKPLLAFSVWLERRKFSCSNLKPTWVGEKERAVRTSRDPPETPSRPSQELLETVHIVTLVIAF